MLASALITLREGFEAALIVAVILAYLRRIGALRYARSVWLGVGLAAVLSTAVGGGLFLAGGELEGSSEALFEGVVMLAAVVVLTWMMLWMRRLGESQGLRLQDDVDAALSTGGATLASMAFLAVLREGIETALFLFAATGKDRPLATVSGALVGLALALAAGYAVYRGSTRLPLRRFFTVTNAVLVVFAVYLVWRGAGEIGEVIGGEAFEIIGPVVAAVYAALVVLGLCRAGRRTAAAHAAGVSGTGESESRSETAVIEAA